jgi:hypothetical protein
MALSDYQLQRVNDVRQWYENVYRSLGGNAPESIRYMTLWAIFNALYNIADYPRVALRGVSIDDGKIKPYIRGRNEDTKLRFISRCFAHDDQFTSSLIQENRRFITRLSHRTPEVQQPLGTTSIQFEHNNLSYTLDLSNLHGIASLDNRVLLHNGMTLFQYFHLDLCLNPDCVPTDRPKFYRQLVFMLYQLRNNIVHGGSAAFFMNKTELSIGALRVLNSLIQYLFNHEELLGQNKYINDEM